MDEYLGMIKIFCGDFAPKGWEFCHGQLKQISQMRKLYSVIGNYYGGDGTSTFALPNLQTAGPLGFGKKDGFSGYKLGEMGGLAGVTLAQDEMPQHSHSFFVNDTTTTINTATNLSSIGIPSLPTGRSRTDTKGFNKLVPDTQLKKMSNTTVTGNNAVHINLQPYLGVNYIICVDGLMPPHP